MLALENIAAWPYTKFAPGAALHGLALSEEARQDSLGHKEMARVFPRGLIHV